MVDGGGGKEQDINGYVKKNNTNSYDLKITNRPDVETSKR